LLERLNGTAQFAYGASVLDKTDLEHLRRNGYRL